MGTLFGIAILIACIFSFIDGATKPRRRRRRSKKHEDEQNAGCCMGCCVVILLFFIIWIGSATVDYVKGHSTAFIVGGIIVFFIGSIVFIIQHFDGEKKEPINPVFPKIVDYPKSKQFKAAPPKTKENTEKVEPGNSQTSKFAAEPEEIVGSIPSATEIVGKIGEDAVSKAVYAACELDKRHYKLLRNVYIPKQNGNYSEIDVLLLHETGVYVFESKNLSGSVYGDMEHLQWQRYKKNGDKEYIPNPIKQNEGHIRALCDFLGQNKYQLRSFSMIVFGSKSQLKFVPNDTVLTSIHEVYNLEMDLIRKMQAQQEFYSVETIDEWCKKLLPCIMLSEEEKQKHKERLTQKFNKVN